MRTRMGQLLLTSGCFFIALMVTACGKSEEEATGTTEKLSITDLAARSMGGQTMEEEAAEYIRNIRFAEMVLGDAVKRSMPCEREMERFKVNV